MYKYLIALLFLFVLSNNGIKAEDKQANVEKPSVDKCSKEAVAMVDKRRQDIMAELKELKDHPWAGTYYRGDGLGVNITLTLAPESGFVFTWYGCLGLYDQNYGEVTWDEKENILRLSFTFENNQKGFQGLNSEFVPVPWEEQHYLVPPARMIDFCNDVNFDLGISFLLRRDGRDKKPKKPAGLPDVPDEYKPYLLKQPVEAKILSTGKTTKKPGKYFSQQFTPVTLDKGSKDGLLPKMELRLVPDVHHGTVRLTKVEESESEGVLEQDMDKKLPKIGSKVSTRYPRAPENND